MITTLNIWAIIGILLTASSSAYAAGVLKLSHTEITLGGGERAGVLEAENLGDNPLYIDIIQELIQTPLTQPEIRTPIGYVTTPSLLVSPTRLTLGPNQKRILNLRILHIPQQRQIWRVTFRPRELITIKTTSEQQTIVPLSVSVGYGVVIYQEGKK